MIHGHTQASSAQNRGLWSAATGKPPQVRWGRPTARATEDPAGFQSRGRDLEFSLERIPTTVTMMEDCGRVTVSVASRRATALGERTMPPGVAWRDPPGLAAPAGACPPPQAKSESPVLCDPGWVGI